MSTKVYEEYTSHDGEYKDEISHVRDRVGVYFGGDPKNTASREIFDNSCDEVTAGYADNVHVILHGDNSLEVRDSGRGIPVDVRDNGMSGIEFFLGQLRSSGKFNNKGAYAKQNQAGLNGMGGAACNFISSRFDVRVYRGGKEYTLCFQRGVPGHYEDKKGEWTPDAPFTPSREMKVKKDSRSSSEKKDYPTGTYIRFKLDPLVASESKFDKENFLHVLRMRTYTIPQLKLHVTDNGETHSYHEPDGLVALMRAQTGDAGVDVEPIVLKGTTSFVRKLTSEDSNGKPVDVPVNVNYEVTIQWNANTYDSVVSSFVNTLNTYEHGSHATSVQSAIGEFFSDRAKKLKLLKDKEEPPLVNDVLESTRLAVSVEYPDPEFVGQHKASIKNTTLYNALKKSILEDLNKWASRKENKEALQAVASKAVNASRVRLEEGVAKASARKKARKSESEGFSMPEKYMACREEGPNAELYIAEGDSARSTIVSARNPNTQACLSLKGKPQNIVNMTAADALKNNEMASIVQVIGAGFGSSFNVENSRFGRIIIATDADVDGSHITTLLLGAFYTHMRPLIEKGMVYIAMPPLFTISVKNGGKVERLYAVTKEDRDKITRQLDRKKKSYIITRNKGLGEMKAVDFRETVLDPKTRVLKRVVLRQDPSETIDLLFSKRSNSADARKDWLNDIRDDFNFDEVV